MSPFYGEIRAFDRELPPGWLPCDGRRLDVDQYRVLFTLLGTRYGGDGRSDFRLPDLRGRVSAGADPRRGQHLGAVSGLGGERATLIPFEVIHWGISINGTFPAQS